MKRLLAMAVLLLASSAAQAQYQFEYGGRTIRIDPDRGTISIPGIYDNTGRKSKRSHQNRPPSQDAKTDTQSPPPPTPHSDTAAAPPPTPPAPPSAAPPTTATAVPEQPATTANNTPADNIALPPPAAPPAPAAPLPPLQQSASPPAPPPPPAPTVAAVPPAPPPPVHSDPNSPVGLWLTEEKEGKVRIEQCGTNLCGYSVDAKTNANGEQVLINMKPAKDFKWSGRILDPNTGSTYDSTIAIKGPDTLRVQGCAFGGMFCGGQTWTRVN